MNIGLPEIIILYGLLVLIFAWNRHKAAGKGTLNQFIAIDLIFPLYSVISVYNFVIKKALGVKIIIIVQLEENEE